MDEILAYFLADPLKLLYFLGGAGGLWFWGEKWLDRIRVRVRFLGHSFDPADDRQVHVHLEFEVVNIGKAPTSLEPYVFCSGYEMHRRREVARLSIVTEDRILPPHSVRRFKATGVASGTYMFWLFVTYRIAPTRGRDRVLYMRSVGATMLSRLRYDLELTLYRQFGWLPFVASGVREMHDD